MTSSTRPQRTVGGARSHVAAIFHRNIRNAGAGTHAATANTAAAAKKTDDEDR